MITDDHKKTNQVTQRTNIKKTTFEFLTFEHLKKAVGIQLKKMGIFIQYIKLVMNQIQMQFYLKPLILKYE